MVERRSDQKEKTPVYILQSRFNDGTYDDSQAAAQEHEYPGRTILHKIMMQDLV